MTQSPDEPTATSTGDSAAQHLPHKKIGRYTIRRVVASGGMGTVYEAVQKSPRRAVAIKVMKHGVTSRFRISDHLPKLAPLNSLA